MSDDSPAVDDPQLGTFRRTTTALTDGSVLTHDWFARTHATDEGEVELMLEATTPDAARALLPRMRATIDALDVLLRTATDAVVTHFSTGAPEAHEVDEAATDLVLDAIEATSDGAIVLHLGDSCGEHFPDGFWPAVRIDDAGTVVAVTVES